MTDSLSTDDDRCMRLTRYKHEFQKASGSREMVQHEDGEWVAYEDVKGVLAFITGYLGEHRGMLEHLRTHPKVGDAVRWLIQEIERV